MQLILPGKTDVAILKLAGQNLYSRLLDAGVRIFEYQPQVLHAKLLIIDDVVYVGSCNLDVRSLRLNFELLIRVPDARIAEQARELVANDAELCKPIEPEQWEKETTWWRKLQCKIAYWLVTRLDPFLARRRLRTLR